VASESIDDGDVLRSGISDSGELGLNDQKLGPERFQVAGLGRRVVATALDWIWLFLASSVIWVVLGAERPLISVILWFPACWCFWTLRNGQTPGKRAMGIQVVRRDGLPITTGTALLRFFGYGVNTGVAFLGWFMVLVDSEHKGLHDRIAGTRVIVDPVYTGAPQPSVRSTDGTGTESWMPRGGGLRRHRRPSSAIVSQLFQNGVWRL
jgi:uncharacterized RDD family membrane protein YckC